MKESENENQFLDLARQLKKIVEHESDGETRSDCRTWHSHQRMMVVFLLFGFYGILTFVVHFTPNPFLYK